MITTAQTLSEEERLQQSSIDPTADSGVHYDVDPRVFELLLDRNMHYSSGYYERGDEDLDTAQEAKLAKAGAWLGLRQGSRLLDVGCGWCGPALHFIQRYGVLVTGVTMSPVQRDYGLRWAAARGLGHALRVDVCDVLNMSYPSQSFDAIVFLESIIHMPPKPEIFRRCFGLLRPGGRIFVQESHYDRDSMRERYRGERGFREVDRAFGHTADLVSGGRMILDLEEAGLVPCALENISRHYIRTLSQWLNNLDENADKMRTISASSYLMLRRYLMIALGTYRSGRTVCHMITAEKPELQ
jgi:cyclopropane-fatty-acyl-phospholipid synthase